MAITFLIIGLLLLAAGLYFYISKLRSFIKDPLTLKMDKPTAYVLGGSLVALSAGLAFLGMAILSAHGEWASLRSYGSGLFEGNAIDYGKNYALIVVGLFLFGLFMGSLWGAFAVHFWKTKLEEPQKKFFNYLMYGSIPLALLAFLLWSEGFAPYLVYPLPSGFHFGSSFGLDYTYTSRSDGNLHIAWYGIIILFGVCVSYWTCDHAFYKEFHKHGILDTLVLIAFPSGVIGARIWYVVGNWSREFANRDFQYVFHIWDGGLTILGGAFAGVVAGFLFLKYRLKYVPIRWAVDVCVPSVLLAQAIGRWGNFFNVEVYGKEVALSSGWNWLPSWLASQMNCINGTSSHLAVGMINAPLFLIEGMLSIAGYFILVYAVGKGLKKYLVPGDLAGGYFLWYGVVRVIMEPMRNENFNMGTDNAWSIANSLVYIVLGFGIILFLHLHDYLLKEGSKKASEPLLASFFLVLALLAPFIRSLTVSSSSNASLAVYSGFAVIFGHSPALLTAYLFLAIALVAYLSELLMSSLKQAKLESYCRYVGLGLSVIGSAMFLLGKDWTDYPSTFVLDGTSYSNVIYSLSYGFVLAALGGLMAAAISASSLWAQKDAAKLLKEKEESNA
jgi:phosphatidylglycerol:prolipoprotein diacylglycerol transferase